MADEFHEAWRRRSRAWSDPDSTWARLQGWYERARLLFEDPDTRRKVFGAQADLFEAHDIRTTITMVAVTNAIMAGLPGKMGVGVFVSIALELWMVRRIGSFVGISIKSGRDALAYLGMLGVTVLGLFEGFRVLLGLAFSLFAFLPVAMVPAELLVTDLVGVLVWVAFEELKQRDRFRVPLRSLGRVKDVTVELLQHQVGLLRRQFRKERLREVSRNLARYFRGEGITERRILHDDAFVAAAFALLLEDDARAFEGPIGRELKAALVDVVPEFEGLDDSELAGRLSEYDGDRLRGLLSSVKGRLFERLVEEAENSDGDAWIARSHPDRTHPGTDLVFANTETGEELEVSLKATDSRAYVEEALARYPDAPLLVTDEAAELFEDDPRVEPTGMSNEDLELSLIHI